MQIGAFVRKATSRICKKIAFCNRCRNSLDVTLQLRFMAAREMYRGC